MSFLKTNNLQKNAILYKFDIFLKSHEYSNSSKKVYLQCSLQLTNTAFINADLKLLKQYQNHFHYIFSELQT